MNFALSVYWLKSILILCSPLSSLQSILILMDRYGQHAIVCSCYLWVNFQTTAQSAFVHMCVSGWSWTASRSIGLNCVNIKHRMRAARNAFTNTSDIDDADAKKKHLSWNISMENIKRTHRFIDTSISIELLSVEQKIVVEKLFYAPTPVEFHSFVSSIIVTHSRVVPHVREPCRIQARLVCRRCTHGVPFPQWKYGTTIK